MSSDKYLISAEPTSSRQTQKSSRSNKNDVTPFSQLDVEQSSLTTSSMEGPLFSVEQIIQAFSTLDVDRNSFIGIKDLRSCLKAIGENPPDEILDAMMSIADTDADGQIAWPDFYTFVSKQMNSMTSREYLPTPPFIPPPSTQQRSQRLAQRKDISDDSD